MIAGAESPVRESRTERASLAVTPYEKRALKLLAVMDDVNESSILRTHTMREILSRAEEIWQRLGK